jgi:YD repeat-containing protein
MTVMMIKEIYFNIWGYNQAYPVVKAENVDYATLNTAVSSIQSDLQGYLKNNIGDLITDTQKNSWKSFNAALRSTASLSNVHITTYTYKPLVGMTSQTDPNGVTTYYEYDSFGRLKCVKDQDKNIIKIYDYHYKE